MGNNGLKKASPELREKYAKFGQEHVFKFLEKLTPEEQSELVKQLEAIDVARCKTLFEASVHPSKSEDSEDAAEKITPVDPKEVASADAIKENKEEWSKKAYESMARGEIAFVVLSGGQGTRLGFDRAKGMYDIGLPSHKSLFQLMGERLRCLRRIVAEATSTSEKKVSIPWYIMTSPLNDADTRSFFKENRNFGLGEKEVQFFPQGTLPCMTPEEGKFILETKGSLAVAPDGNGGIYHAMETNGIFADMKTRGVKYMHVTSVDNSLVQPADPIFVGFCLSKDAEVGNKGCPKVSWDEKVGVMARKNDKPSVVEYSELDEALAKQTDEEGNLLFRSGNICNHLFSIDFLQNKALPALANTYHVAHKKIPYANDEGVKTTPTSPNGIKLEMFIFDVFPHAANFAVFECDREEEFAPVKNAPGEATDSPDSARAMTFALHRRWLESSKANLETENDAKAETLACEVSPLVSMRGEGLEKLVQSISSLKLPLNIRLASESPAVDKSKKRESVSSEDAPLQVKHYVNADNINIYEIAGA